MGESEIKIVVYSKNVISVAEFFTYVGEEHYLCYLTAFLAKSKQVSFARRAVPDSWIDYTGYVTVRTRNEQEIGTNMCTVRMSSSSNYSDLHRISTLILTELCNMEYEYFNSAIACYRLDPVYRIQAFNRCL